MRLLARTLLALSIGVLLFPARALSAQGFGGGGGRGAAIDPSVLWGLPDYRGGFTFCRLMFTAVRRDDSGTGWRIEYPRADMNFMTRLSQLTLTPISEWPNGSPGHTVVRATDPELFSCPFVMMSSPGTVGFSEEEANKLRTYLLKGGFLWGDDFWGNASWAHWEREVGRILPGYAIVELTPEHPIFSTFYRIDAVPQIPSLNRYRQLGGSTSEMGAESATAHMRGIFDDKGRLLVLMTHNTDIADGWEREADLDSFFQRFAWQAYSVGMNVAIWMMTR